MHNHAASINNILMIFSSPGRSPEELMHYPSGDIEVFKSAYLLNHSMDLVYIGTMIDIGSQFRSAISCSGL